MACFPCLGSLPEAHEEQFRNGSCQRALPIRPAGVLLDTIGKAVALPQTSYQEFPGFFDGQE